MAGDFDDQLEKIKAKLDDAFARTFSEKGYRVFDTALIPRPTALRESLRTFWGGYTFSFKIIEHEKYRRLKNDAQKLRTQATIVNEEQKRTFNIDISKYEYCDAKEPIDLEGYTIYVYPPLILVYEKLRALCQQLEEYRAIVPQMQRRPRARDFFDIYSLLENPATTMDLCDLENLALLKAVFAAKKVPLDFLAKLEAERDFHRQDFRRVEDTVSPDVTLQSFDFYFDYVLGKVEQLVEKLSG